MNTHSIIVIGAGHAGIEAATAAARMGARVSLLSIQLETIAQMPCNPSIGGIAKGHLVKEIDLLGGWMGRVADRTAIHFKTLNRSKGPAVRASRTQNDKDKYRTFMRSTLESIPNISLYQVMAVGLRTKGERVTGVKLQNGEFLDADAVIITPGTFLNGQIIIGESSFSAGRANEPASIDLSSHLQELGFQMNRLKTGTPMRLHSDSIDYSSFTPQPGDEPPIPFSIYTHIPLRNRVLCYIGRTTPELKRLIQDHIHLNPLYSGKIHGIGPRYCPSLEDKIMKFPDKESHHFFLEPEGMKSKEIYINGFSTSFSVEIQRRILQTIPGLSQARITRPAYAIEYDAIQPTQLTSTLASRFFGNLYFAGQINGTSGYEEAAGQGIIAGINAVLALTGKPPFVLNRNESYIGVMIDDLIHRGFDEPYRLFTSRAEYRLQLREDNVFERLGSYAFRYRLIAPKVLREQERLAEKRQRILNMLTSTRVIDDDDSRTLAQLLKRPDIDWDILKNHHPIPLSESLSPFDIAYIEAKVKYSGYIDIQNREVLRANERNAVLIPDDLDFHSIPGLSTELRQKLERIKPASLGEARQIPGITPAALNAISIYLTLQKKAKGNDFQNKNNISEEKIHEN